MNTEILTNWNKYIKSIYFFNNKRDGFPPLIFVFLDLDGLLSDAGTLALCFNYNLTRTRVNEVAFVFF